ncbi:MAG: hypothetical protein R2717_02910 [Schumannella sp.]
MTPTRRRRTCWTPRRPGSPTAISRIDEDALRTVASQLGVGYQHRTAGSEPQFPDVEDRMGQEIEVPEVAVAQRLYWVPIIPAFLLLLWDLVLAARNVGELREGRPGRKRGRHDLVHRPVRARGRSRHGIAARAAATHAALVDGGRHPARSVRGRDGRERRDPGGGGSGLRGRRLRDGGRLGPSGSEPQPGRPVPAALQPGHRVRERRPAARGDRTLQTSLDHAPSPEAACYPRANLALTYVRLGNRYYDGGLWREAINAHRAAKALWAEQPDDVCHDDPSFDQTAEESSEEASQGEQQAQEQQQNQPPDPTQTPSPDPSATPTPDPSATPTPDPSASPTPDPSASPTPDPSASPTPGPTQSPTPGPSGSPTPGQSGSPTPGPSGSPTPGPSGSPTPGPSGSPTPDPSGSPTTGPGGEGDQPSSEALGEKLDELIAQNQAADRERENGGPKHGLADKPW